MEKINPLAQAHGDDTKRQERHWGEGPLSGEERAHVSCLQAITKWLQKALDGHAMN